MDSKMDDLARLIAEHNAVIRSIARLIGRPANIGNVGEYIAGVAFDIQLQESANNKSYDGRFRSGPLAGQSVNVKWYSQQQTSLDLTETPPDWYLVLVGPPAAKKTMVKWAGQWAIESVFLFNGPSLTDTLRRNGCLIGLASSVRREYWERARVYPCATTTSLQLTADQLRLLGLFSSDNLFQS
ncbi:MAG TPA: hypothetical protein PKG77_25505 [Phycisphaerae bacterium]|nr:hypothetical protein [Phycisphaerae bacterium]HQL76242.1 hypothetical protein [Phycisphaerae bacterium]